MAKVEEIPLLTPEEMAVVVEAANEATAAYIARGFRDKHPDPWVESMLLQRHVIARDTSNKDYANMQDYYDGQVLFREAVHELMQQETSVKSVEG